MIHKIKPSYLQKVSATFRGYKEAVKAWYKGRVIYGRKMRFRHIPLYARTWQMDKPIQSRKTALKANPEEQISTEIQRLDSRCRTYIRRALVASGEKDTKSFMTAMKEVCLAFHKRTHLENKEHALDDLGNDLDRQFKIMLNAAFDRGVFEDELLRPHSFINRLEGSLKVSFQQMMVQPDIDQDQMMLLTQSLIFMRVLADHTIKDREQLAQWSGSYRGGDPVIISDIYQQ